MQGYYDSAADQQLVIDRMNRQVVPFVLLLTDEIPEWRKDFSLVDAFIESRFRPMVDVPVSGDRSVRILVNTAIAAPRVDAATGWPCYRGP